MPDDDIFSTAFGIISDQTARGAQSTGAVADFIIRAGLSVAAATQLLNSISQSAAATPAQLNYVQNEMRYLNDEYYNLRQNRNQWAGPAIALGLIWLLTRDN